jgi:hypothetical protein
MGGETIFVPEHHNQNSPDDDVGRLLRPSIPRRGSTCQRESNVSCLGTPCMTKCTLATVHRFDMVDLHTWKEPKVVGGG